MPQQARPQHQSELVLGFGVAEIQAAARVEGQHERQPVLVQIVEEERSVVEEQDASELEAVELVGVVSGDLAVRPRMDG